MSDTNTEKPNTEEEKPVLIHCIYASAAVEDFSKETLNELLKVARENNQSLEVTGMLLYHEGSFFQVLEGDPDVVADLYKKIAGDKRHDRIIKLIEEPIEVRNFSEWTMGYAKVSDEELKQLPGLSDCIIRKGFFGELAEGRTRDLLKAFKKGKWRQAIG